MHSFGKFRVNLSKPHFWKIRVNFVWRTCSSSCQRVLLISFKSNFFLYFKSSRKPFFSHIYQCTTNKKYSDHSVMRLTHLYAAPEVAFLGPSTPEEFKNRSFTSNVFHPPQYGKRNIQWLFFICVWGNLGQRNHMFIVMSWFSKCSVFKMFFVHTKTQSRSFQIPLVWRACSFLWRISMEGRSNRRSELPFKIALDECNNSCR